MAIFLLERCIDVWLVIRGTIIQATRFWADRLGRITGGVAVLRLPGYAIAGRPKPVSMSDYKFASAG